MRTPSNQVGHYIKSRKNMNKSTMLPRIEGFKGRIITVDQFNQMVTEEMSMIRDLKKCHKKGFKSVQQIFHETDPLLRDQGSKSSMF